MGQCKDNWIKKRNRDVEALNEYANNLERRERMLVDRLSSLAMGYGKDGDFKTHDLAMQAHAANVLVTLAMMDRPSRPCIWWA